VAAWCPLGFKCGQAFLLYHFSVPFYPVLLKVNIAVVKGKILIHIDAVMFFPMGKHHTHISTS